MPLENQCHLSRYKFPHLAIAMMESYKRWKQNLDAAKQLKQELDETKEKVETLEVEVQEKDIEIQQIKESKTNFDKMISEKSEEKDSEIKSLSPDSVMVGDSVMGGVKIDKQINNDPDAIARASSMLTKWERVIHSRVYRHKRET